VLALVVLIGGGFAVAWVLTRGGSPAALDGGALLAAALPLATQPASGPATQPASQPAFVTVRIVTRPPGALVRIGARDYGPSPVEVKLPRGKQPLPVRAQATGFEDAADSLTPLRDANMTLALREKPRPIRVGVRPPAPTGTKTPGGPIDETAPSPYKKPPKK